MQTGRARFVPTDLLRGNVLDMEGARYLWTLPLFAALGAAGIYLQLARGAGKTDGNERSSGIGISLAALAGIVASLSKLPLQQAESRPSYTIPLLMLLGSAAAFCAGGVVVCRTKRAAIRAMSALCLILAGLLVFGSWIVSLALLLVGGLLAMAALRIPAKAVRSEDRSETLEPFLSCVAGGLLVLTMFTTITSAAITSGRFVSDDAAQVVQETIKESTARQSTPAGHFPIVAGTGALVLLCLLAGFRFRNDIAVASDGSGDWQ